MTARGNLEQVRNPLLRLQSAQAIKDLPDVARMALRAVLLDLSVDAHALAIRCWAKHKAPMACYWKAVAVYARHAARLTLPKSREFDRQAKAMAACVELIRGDGTDASLQRTIDFAREALGLPTS